jgi:hypothetical protein
MSVATTRTVKYERKGEAGNSVVTANTDTRSYTYVQWQTYGTKDSVNTWTGIANAASMKIGDTMIIPGICTDRDNAAVQLYTTVNSIAGTSVTAAAVNVIVGGANGTNGAKGEQGAVLRGPQAWSDCADGYNFQAGGAGEEWKDVVLYNGNYYSCVKSHSKNANAYPGSTADTNVGLWKLGDNIELVATKILLATYALVKNLGVEVIDMKDADGNVIFQAKDGNVTCKTGTFDGITVRDASIVSGQIAGFKIDGDGLTNDPFTNDAYVIFRNDTRGAFAGIGGNVLPASSGIRGVARFENKDTTGYYGLDVNYAAIIAAQGAASNHAIHIDGGDVSGFAMRNTIISETAKTLERTDYNVVCINTSELTITLPTMQLYDDGHVVRIKRLGSGSVKLALGKCYTYNNSTGASRYSTPILIYNQNAKLKDTDTLTFDGICDAMELVWVRDVSYTVNSTTYYGAWVQYKLPRDW